MTIFPLFWTSEKNNLFEHFKTSPARDSELAIPNKTHLFYNTLDAFFGHGAVLFHYISEN